MEKKHKDDSKVVVESNAKKRKKERKQCKLEDSTAKYFNIWKKTQAIQNSTHRETVFQKQRQNNEMPLNIIRMVIRKNKNKNENNKCLWGCGGQEF